MAIVSVVLSVVALAMATCACSWSDGSCVSELILTTDTLPRPFGLEEPPRFSWRPTEEGASMLARGSTQTGYTLQIAIGPTSTPDEVVVWNVTKMSNSSSLVRYDGPALKPGLTYHWRVSPTWSNVSDTSTPSSLDIAPPLMSQFWSIAATFSVAPATFNASFIGLGSGMNQSSCPWLRREFELSQPIDVVTDVAIVYVGSVGYHELWLNGAKVNADVLSPQITDLAKRIPVRACDVTALLKPGKNVIGLWLSVGWAGFTSVNPAVVDFFNTTNAPIALAHMVLQHGAIGTLTQVLKTDATWSASPSNTAHIGLWKNSNFGGDRIVSSLTQTDWSSETGGKQATWVPVTTFNTPTSRVLSCEVLEPNQLREKIHTNATITNTDGSFYIKFDRLFTGFISVSNVVGKPFATVTFNAATIPICGSKFAVQANESGRPFCIGGKAGDDANMEYNMQHELVLDAMGVGSFETRFSSRK
eukprot:m.120655 g.120655  ORF g.120655 m.120655 type:complete len:474 (-) comp28822_c0_seq2:1730-3151(-)